MYYLSRPRMISRRDILTGAAMATAAIFTQPKNFFAIVAQSITPVNFDAPRDSCDCHVHIFGDPQRFPFASDRVYTPQPASIDKLRTLHRALHIERVVIVQPSVYGTDNSCTLDALQRVGHNARGIAVIDEKIGNSHLDRMHELGVRGIRINLETAGEFDPAFARKHFQSAVAQLRRRTNWHIQIYTRPSVIAAIHDEVAASPVPVVFDHFGGAQAAQGIEQPGFEALLSLLKNGKAYVKLSAPYRSSTVAPDYPDVIPLAKALITANPQRALWGSDWPHPQQIQGRNAHEITPPYNVDDGHIFDLLTQWVPAAAERRAILVENPAKLYGF
jgi:predicted TIM-barrel fold metal-dependent hydrolase